MCVLHNYGYMKIGGMGLQIHAPLSLNIGRKLLVARAVFEALWKRKPSYFCAE
jgi:hypothetical protein